MSIDNVLPQLVLMDRRRAIKNFFRTMEQDSTEAWSKHLDYLQTALLNFSDKEVEFNANMVYDMYTELNRFEDSDGKPLRNLMDTMKVYEKRASTFTESQRDHFVHSVNVFLLGIQIYIGSKRFRDAFAASDPNTTFRNVHERFLFVWGHAALFHDIGYPMEIASNQAKTFARTIENMGNKGDEKKTNISMLVWNFDRISEMPADKWRGEGQTIDLISLLSRRVSERISIGYDDVYRIIARYVDIMRDARFVDHGFYSSLILLRSMGSSMQAAGYTSTRFDDEIVEAAAAILLHNMYRGVFVSERYDYNCSPMDLDSSPVPFLLILCDELQDWNRRKYGIKTKDAVYPDNSRTSIDGDVFTINYHTIDDAMCSTFVSDKIHLLRNLLKLDGLFSDVRITCSCDRSADMLIASLEENVEDDFPRPMIDSLEKMAMEIHAEYNRKRRLEKPDEPLEYPTWDGLPQDLKYSNMMQAMSIPDKLNAIGCHIGKSSDGKVVAGFTPEEILIMAMMEHDRWRAERESNGWIWGPQKDVDNRISPYIADWDKIPEEIRKYDVEAVENIIPLLDHLGLKVLRNE